MADADSSEQDEIVQAEHWHSSSSSSTVLNEINATPTTMTKNTTNLPNKTSPLIDESTTNGFTTAPATSEEDNLDYESDDDDDSRSNHSNNNTSNNSVIFNSGRHHSKYSKQMVKGEEKRSHHNVLERKRRDLLKDSFSKLRDSVPTTQPKDRVSRAEILKQAADFIQSTVQRNALIRAELDELVRKNRELEEEKKAQGADLSTCDAKSYLELNDSGAGGGSGDSGGGGAGLGGGIGSVEVEVKQEY